MSLELEIATVFRAMPGERACGDRAVRWEDGDDVLVAVVDGLGHGPHAEIAAVAAVDYIAEHRDAGLDPLIHGCDKALRGTRGAVLTLVRIRRSTGEAWHAAIGNVEARFVGSGDVPLLTTPGVVGARIRKIRERAFEFCAGSTLIIHTDGISSRFRLGELHGQSAEAIARTLLRDHAKDHDDAGCAVIVS
ncbi:MAG: SpoIIE family protein phosphatase [Myxococcales bacterium]|nr:SpoIIE family protein phosphatase [Myxococcales bacterium]